MELEIRHLRLVDAIAREGGITRASKSLYLTQSALSHQLREIEQRLGTPLFLRIRRKMVLTEAGRRVLISARTILEELRRAEEEVRRLGQGTEGVLRISTQCNTCYHWLPSLIQGFNKLHPRVEVQVNVEATQDPLQALWRGELDLAILHTRPPEKGLTIYPLFEDELMATMHPDHPLAKRDYIRAEDFADQSLLVYRIPKEENMLFQKVLMPAGVNPVRTQQVMLTEAIIEMVKAGLGISVLARWFTSPYIRNGELKAVRVTRKGLMRQWVAATVARPSAPSYFLDFVRILSKSSLPAVDATRKRGSSGPRFYAIS